LKGPKRNNFPCASAHGDYTKSAGYKRSESGTNKPEKKVSTDLLVKSTCDLEALQYGLETTAETVEPLGTNIETSANCPFLTIRSELSIMVYELLLKSMRTINAPNFITGPQKSVIIGGRPQINDLDVVILRTSRSIYHEAFRTLYRKNDIYFTGPFDVAIFGYSDLAYSLVFGLEHVQHNRLTAIKTITLKVGNASMPVLRMPGDPVHREPL